MSQAVADGPHEPSGAELVAGRPSPKFGHRPLAEIDRQIEQSRQREVFYRATDARSATIQEAVTNRLLDERAAATR